MDGTGSALHGYNNLSQYRKDTWASMEEATERLADAVAADRPLEMHVERVNELIDRLSPISTSRRLFATGKYTRFARAVASASRAMATDSFRNGIPWSIAAAITEPSRIGASDDPTRKAETDATLARKPGVSTETRQPTVRHGMAGASEGIAPAMPRSRHDRRGKKHTPTGHLAHSIRKGHRSVGGQDGAARAGSGLPPRQGVDEHAGASPP